MKYLLLITVLSCSASESVKVYRPSTLKESAAKAFLQQPERKEKESLQAYVEKNNIPGECKPIIARQYLKERGYSPVNSLTGHGIFLWLYKDLQEEETTFFSEGADDHRVEGGFNEEAHYRNWEQSPYLGNETDFYRPTRFSQNPFLQEDGSFAYAYQEHYTLREKLKDTITGKAYEAFLSALGRALLVGPSKQSRYAVIAKNDEELRIYDTSRIDQITTETIIPGEPERKKELSPHVGFEHYQKGNIGDVSHSENSIKDPRAKGYVKDYPTALTMDEETSYCYGGTASGKLYCYSFYTDISRLRRGWLGYMFPTTLDTKIDDIELSTDSAYLWILSDNKLYCYDMRLNELNVKLTIPTIPSEHIEDETPERMCILRRGKDSRWWTLGGTKGTVLLADVEKGQCFTLTSFNENKPIAEIWWKDNEVVLLNRAGKLRRGTVLAEYAEEFFQEIPVAEE